MALQNLRELTPLPTFQSRCAEASGIKPEKTCPNCGNSIQFAFMDKVTYLNSVGKNPHWAEVSCRVCEEIRESAERDQQLIECRLKASGLGERFSQKTLDTFVHYGSAREKERQNRIHQEINQYALFFSEHRESGTCLLFMGTVGTGKGHLCAGILNHIIRGGFTGMFVKMPTMLREIKETFSNRHNEETYSRIITNMVDCDLLIIDEIGVQFGTDTERMIIYDILDQRYEAMLPVILTTNVMDLKSLETYLGDKIIDRFYEGDSKIYRFEWHSYRKFQRGGQ